MAYCTATKTDNGKILLTCVLTTGHETAWSFHYDPRGIDWRVNVVPTPLASTRTTSPKKSARRNIAKSVMKAAGRTTTQFEVIK